MLFISIALVNIFLIRPQYLVKLVCPQCEEKSVFVITKQKGADTTHSETKYCPKCHESFEIIVYFDGSVIIERCLYCPENTANSTIDNFSEGD